MTNSKLSVLCPPENLHFVVRVWSAHIDCKCMLKTLICDAALHKEDYVVILDVFLANNMTCIGDYYRENTL